MTIEEIVILVNNIIKSCEYEHSIKSNIVKPLGKILSMSNSHIVNEGRSLTELSNLKDIAVSIISLDDIKVKRDLIESSIDFTTLKDSTINKILYEVVNSALTNQQDLEQKNTICKNLIPIFKGLKENDGSAHIGLLLKSLQTLIKDPNLIIRKSLANNVLKICPFISKSSVIDSIFVIFLELLKDENLEVRIELLSTMEDVDPYLSMEETFNSIYPQLLEIAQSKSWRVRFQLSMLFMSFTKVLSENSFIAKVFPIYLSWLSDPVYAIRKEGARIINEVIKKYPETIDDVFAKIAELKESKTYLLRVTLAYLIECFTLDIKNKSLVERHLVPIVLDLAKSNISNIVINCEKTIKELIHIPEVKMESQFILNLVNKYKNQ